MPRTIDFAKGHGTLNDFVVFADPDGTFDPTPGQVRFLCDRRAGVGADGMLRAVPGRHVPEWDGDPDVWFMDYRNADGSVAEMCGNGVRVFLLFLKRAGLVDADVTTLPVGTRAGARTGEYLPDGRLRVWMGRPTGGGRVRVASGPIAFDAASVDVGNPHAVSVLCGPAELAALDLTKQPIWTPEEAFPEGVNLEFVHAVGPGEVRMRVFERGVGETLSCGTGTVAAAYAMAARDGVTDGRYTVHVPGGCVEVELSAGDAYLTGPAEIVSSGSVVVPDPQDAP